MALNAGSRCSPPFRTKCTGTLSYATPLSSKPIRTRCAAPDLKYVYRRGTLMMLPLNFQFLRNFQAVKLRRWSSSRFSKSNHSLADECNAHAQEDQRNGEIELANVDRPD